ncbi:cytochrome P450 [Mastigocoleus testarum]|uniref:Cytochrome P450 n=1 Tax=Mastigocoleus testarum BC008 TaxID=371196 RepID=A0A0V7ZNJ5_9CYAN|nr:cytochrome P450 [Mastigocoleus testarum]KST66131.1 cytochrome P450 [Mastigocoleus testarum BC008]
MKLDKHQSNQDIFSLPGPQGNFLLGSLIDFARDPLLFMTQCVREYGEITPLRLGSKKVILLAKPEYIQQMLKDRATFTKSMALKSMHALLGQGLLTSEGETWFRQRRLAQPVFHQKRIADYGEIMVTNTQKMLANWQDGDIKDIQSEMMHLTFSIIMKTLFNKDVLEDEAHDVAQAMQISSEWMITQRKSLIPFPEIFPTPSNLRYHNAIKKLDKYIYRIVDERRSSGEDPGDLLSMMMQARDEDDGTQMNDKQLRDEIATLIFAGHETSANTLAWTWMLLSQHPTIQTKLRLEVEQVLGDRTPTFTDIPALKYTSMIIKEAMRLYPVVWTIIADTSRECTIGNYHVPGDCTVITSQWVMHRWERYFEEPESFKPERWAEDLEKRLPQGVYTPFGGGPRTCIGKNFALMEAVLLLVTIVQKFEINLIPNQSIVPEPTITLQPKNGIKVVLNKLPQPSVIVA